MSLKGDVIKRLVGIKCPKCNEDIDFLKNYASGENYYTVWDNEDGSMRYEEEEFQPDGKVNDYECER